MSLADDLANGGTFTGWSFHHPDTRKASLRRAGMRGSAAFFALLLAAASSSPADDSAETGLLASGSHIPDGNRLTLPRAPAQPAQIAAASKFSRRRMPLSLPTLKGQSRPA